MKKTSRKAQGRSSYIKSMVVAAFILGYLVFTVYKYGIERGIGITALTWAFFVFLTPVPSAGFILELPVRLLTNHKMLMTQYIVWCLGAAIVIPALLFSPQLFHTTALLSVFYYVLTNPVPYWSLLLLCGVGTLLSVHIIDEIMDEVEDEIRHYHRKHTPVLYMAVFVLVLIGIILAYDSMVSGFQLKWNLGLF